MTKTFTLEEALRDYFNIHNRGNWGVIRYDTESGDFWADEYVDENSYTVYPENVRRVLMDKVEWGLESEFGKRMTLANAIKYINQNFEWVTTP